tara:strand:+ start:46 stop:432 length:387 start_codon:yes stop_codon:yes gene_type:complete
MLTGHRRGEEIEPYDEWLKRYGREDFEYGDPRRPLSSGERRRGRRNPAGWDRGFGGSDWGLHSNENWGLEGADPAVLAEHDRKLEQHFAKIRLQNKRDKVGQYSPREEARRKGWAKAHARKKKESESR